MLTIHRVKEVLGEDFANALYETFPGEQLNIPKKKCSMQFESLDARNQYIFNLFTSAGKSYDEIADRMELSKDRVMKIISDIIKNK